MALQFTKVSPTSGKGNESLSVSVEDNPQTLERSEFFTIRGQNNLEYRISVNQKAGGETITFTVTDSQAFSPKLQLEIRADKILRSDVILIVKLFGYKQGTSEKVEDYVDIDLTKNTNYWYKEKDYSSLRIIPYKGQLDSILPEKTETQIFEVSKEEFDL